MQKSPDSQTDELDWQAFRYLAEEMSAEERSAFEVRLEHDLAACEALARSVELTNSIALVEQFTPAEIQPARVLATRWSARLSWLATGVLATVLVAAIVNRPWSYSAPVNDELAAAWSAAQTEWPVEGDESVAEELPFIDEVELPSAPGWMLAAVRGLNEIDMDSVDSSVGPFNNESREN